MSHKTMPEPSSVCEGLYFCSILIRRRDAQVKAKADPGDLEIWSLCLPQSAPAKQKMNPNPAGVKPFVTGAVKFLLH